jgi:hypothetical protein
MAKELNDNIQEFVKQFDNDETGYYLADTRKMEYFSLEELLQMFCQKYIAQAVFTGEELTLMQLAVVKANVEYPTVVDGNITQSIYGKLEELRKLQGLEGV